MLSSQLEGVSKLPMRYVRRPWNRQRPLAFDRLVCRRGVSQHLCGGFGSGWHELRSLSGKLIRERMVIGCGLDLFNKQPKQEQRTKIWWKV